MSRDWTEALAAELDAGDLAVFDADGTLWADDVGEGFQAVLIAEGALPRSVDEEYMRLVRTDFAGADESGKYSARAV